MTVTSTLLSASASYPALTGDADFGIAIRRIFAIAVTVLRDVRDLAASGNFLVINWMVGGAVMLTVISLARTQMWRVGGRPQRAAAQLGAFLLSAYVGLFVVSWSLAGFAPAALPYSVVTAATMLLSASGGSGI